MCDKATVHSSVTFIRARQQFEEQFNCIFIHGSSDEHVSIPGGWGALGTVESFRADAFALQQLKCYQDGKLVLAAWVKRGFTSIEDVAKWFHDGDVEQAKASLEQTRGAMASILELDEVPEIDDHQERAALDRAQAGPMAGEMQTWWAIADLRDESLSPQVLPSWMKVHLDRVVLVWLREKNIWDGRFEKRMEVYGKNTLGPKMQSAFEKWNACNTRTIVFDKESRTTVNDFRSRSQNWLRKRCFLVTLTLSENAQDLRISAGNGQEWRLKLLQGAHAGDEVPAAMDHWVGRG
eukprot:s1070_g16.t1